MLEGGVCRKSGLALQQEMHNSRALETSIFDGGRRNYQSSAPKLPNYHTHKNKLPIQPPYNQQPYINNSPHTINSPQTAGSPGPPCHPTCPVAGPTCSMAWSTLPPAASPPGACGEPGCAPPSCAATPGAWPGLLVRRRRERKGAGGRPPTAPTAPVDTWGGK